MGFGAMKSSVVILVLGVLAFPDAMGFKCGTEDCTGEKMYCHMTTPAGGGATTGKCDTLKQCATDCTDVSGTTKCCCSVTVGDLTKIAECKTEWKKEFPTHTTMDCKGPSGAVKVDSTYLTKGYCTITKANVMGTANFPKTGDGFCFCNWKDCNQDMDKCKMHKMACGSGLALATADVKYAAYVECAAGKGACMFTKTAGPVCETVANCMETSKCPDDTCYCCPDPTALTFLDAKAAEWKTERSTPLDLKCAGGVDCKGTKKWFPPYCGIKKDGTNKKCFIFESVCEDAEKPDGCCCQEKDCNKDLTTCKKDQPSPTSSAKTSVNPTSTTGNRTDKPKPTTTKKNPKATTKSSPIDNEASLMAKSHWLVAVTAVVYAALF